MGKRIFMRIEKFLPIIIRGRGFQIINGSCNEKENQKEGSAKDRNCEKEKSG